MAKPWDLSHDPDAKPLGCNGKYGYSGRDLHTRAGEPVCDACKESANHAARETRRSQPVPRPLQPCGTRAASRRHKAKGEDLDYACKIAPAAYRAELKARKTK